MSLDRIVDRGIVPLFEHLGAWSLRWGVLIGLLALWLRLFPPRGAFARRGLLLGGLIAGLLLPFFPSWTVKREIPRASGPVAPSPLPDSTPFVVDDAPEPEAPREVVPPAAARRMPISRRELSWMALAVVWCVGVVWSSAGLAAGWMALRRLRQGSTPIGPSDGALFASCLREIGLRRETSLASHPAIRCPLAIGGLRPLVLVPDDWNELTESSRRACLLHELAHLKRWDDLVKLLGELVLVPFFFHAPVRRLIARLGRETERLCDESAVALGVDPRELARLLLHYAVRGDRVASRPAALSFFERGTILERINALTEDDMTKTSTRPSPLRTAALACGLLAISLPVGGLRVVAEARDEPTPAVKQASTPAQKFKGTVIDEAKTPIAGAKVLVWTQPGTSSPIALESDADGRFAFDFPAPAFEYKIVASKAGRALGSTFGFQNPADPARPDPIVVLRPPAAFELTLVDENDRPIVGALARIESTASWAEVDRPMIFDPKAGAFREAVDLPKGAKTYSMCFNYYPVEAGEEGRFGASLKARSDARGRLRFDAVPPKAWLKLAVTTPDGRSARVDVGGDAAKSVSPLQKGFVDGDPAKAVRRRLIPAARIVGRVTTKLPGVSVANRTVGYQSCHPKTGREFSGNLTGEARTDAEGRFHFDSLEAGRVNIFPSITKAEPITCKAAADVALVAGGTAEVELELIEGVEVEGRVASADGTPIAGARIGSYGPHMPRSGAACISAATDAEGVYRLRVPAGSNYLYFMTAIPGHVHDVGRNGTTVSIPDAAKWFTVPTFTVERAP